MISMKKDYLAPCVELFPMETEGAVMTPSVTTGSPGYDGGASFQSATSGRAGYGTGTNYSASGTDLEEMINDILTY
jgi:hypothetical protein